VLDDLNNELVPRWVELTVERDAPLPHRVVIEDRQPNWDNPQLMARLRRL
jgi:7-cyano-7-deazaguanine reductase